MMILRLDSMDLRFNKAINFLHKIYGVTLAGILMFLIFGLDRFHMRSKNVYEDSPSEEIIKKAPFRFREISKVLGVSLVISFDDSEELKVKVV